jgi:hypothetical protein
MVDFGTYSILGSSLPRGAFALIRAGIRVDLKNMEANSANLCLNE